VHDAIRTPICATLADDITTLTQWERDPIAHVTEDFSSDSPLYQVLQRRNVYILVASDGGHKDGYGSSSWVIKTKDKVIWDCQGITRGCPMQSYRAKGCGRVPSLVIHSLRSLLRDPTGG
jgi:hypothetical protein